MTSRSMAGKIETRHLLEVEAREIQMAIEFLNRYGFEHHISNLILQRARDERFAKAEKLTEQIMRIAEEEV